MKVLDCTLRDGGYYNSWDFPAEVTHSYLEAMAAAGVDIVELGLRSLVNKGFKGANAFTSDAYIQSLAIPTDLQVAVMINASEIVGNVSQEEVLRKLFPLDAGKSTVDIVRIACHVNEFIEALPACNWLKARGYAVGFNLMQVADRTQQEVEALSLEVSKYPIDVLYFADSMGSMNGEQTTQIIGWFRRHWQGAMGIHTHDNMGLALTNTLQAASEGVTWLDATVTGMGRGPGNARTEELAIEVASLRKMSINIVPLMSIIRRYFQPLKKQCGWGSNPYYYLSGKYCIHPTYIQEMLSDTRYDEEDLLAVIEHLRVEGGKKFSFNTLEAARDFYKGTPKGSWQPKSRFEGRKVLLLGTGPGVKSHRAALERYIREYSPLVVALNTQSGIAADLIDLRVACHPVRLLADCEAHTQLPQPLITPYSMLPNDVKHSLGGKEVLDFGLKVEPDRFEFSDNWCATPTSLVMAYAFAIAACGKSRQILMAGFDGYAGEDPRNEEMNKVVKQYQQSPGSTPLIAITPTRYDVQRISIYGIHS